MFRKVQLTYGFIMLVVGIVGLSLIYRVYSGHSIVAGTQQVHDGSPAVKMPLAQLSGPLSGVRIALSPGHGQFQENEEMWLWERSEFWGIREDIVNAEIVMYLGQYLSEQGATVIYLRDPEKNGSVGASGVPRWQESTRHYLQYLGLPAHVWDERECDAHRMPKLCKDWRARTSGAAFFGADLLISLHNNGGGGTGSETFYDVTGEYHDPALAANLAQKAHNRMLDVIWSQYDNGWVDRGISARAGAYSEIRFARMPAILIEAAFMDTQWPDNQALQDETFKQLVAKGIGLGICDYYNVLCENNETTQQAATSIVLNQPQLLPANNGNVCDSAWYQYINDRGFVTYLTLNRQLGAAAPPITNHASWRPAITQAGIYKVEAFIPSHSSIEWSCPTMMIEHDSSSASYVVYYANGSQTVVRDQYPLQNEWLNLGSYYFNADSSGYVTLSDETNEGNYLRTVSFSGMRFTLLGDDGQPQASQPAPVDEIASYRPIPADDIPSQEPAPPTSEELSPENQLEPAEATAEGQFVPSADNSNQPAEDEAEAAQEADSSNQPAEDEAAQEADNSNQPAEGEAEAAQEANSNQPAEGEAEAAQEPDSSNQPAEDEAEAAQEADNANQPAEGEAEAAQEANSTSQPAEGEVAPSENAQPAAEEASVGIVTQLGDVNCNALIEVADGLSILQHDVGLLSASNECPSANETLFAPHCEVNGDGYCNAVDGLLVLQCESGIANALCPAGEITSNQPVFESSIFAVEMAQLPAESAATIPINTILPAGVSLGAAKVTMTYDPNLIVVESCTTNPNALGVCNTQGYGVIELNLVTISGMSGTVTLGQITFQVIGEVGNNTPLDIGVQAAADVSGQPIPVYEMDGQIVIVEPVVEAPAAEQEANEP